ncbi:hypothetical protein D4764_02G0001050 [Takifugu flavidus]|uniref:Uncharacterized protein n=1 Tax=Takifugu flavidus TaxID=433684 RepID=A0A5C6NHS9_9TELE|nr:hypothetical protein D4764_02G0001050 [Takifugu flavidus]
MEPEVENFHFRFFFLYTEIKEFVQSRGEDAALLEDTGWTLDLAFLTDITGKRNSLNWELQGKVWFRSLQNSCFMALYDSGMDTVSPNQTRFPQKVLQLSTKATWFSGHHRDSQRRSDDMRLNISSLARLGRGPENAPESHIVFA